MPLGYNVRKAAQVVAFLVAEQGDNASLIKTVKLAYMADRRFLELYDIPILNDDFYCLDHGPIDTATYDYIKGQGRERKAWEEYLRGRKGNVMQLARPADELDFDEISEAEEEVLREIVQTYRGMRPFELVDYIHQNCAEWDDPKGTSVPLSYEDVFEALGKEKPRERVRHVKERRQLMEAVNSDG